MIVLLPVGFEDWLYVSGGSQTVYTRKAMPVPRDTPLAETIAPRRSPPP